MRLAVADANLPCLIPALACLHQLDSPHLPVRVYGRRCSGREAGPASPTSSPRAATTDVTSRLLPACKVTVGLCKAEVKASLTRPNLGFTLS